MKGLPQKVVFYAILLGDYNPATNILFGNALQSTTSEHQMELFRTFSSITLEREARMIVCFLAKDKMSLGEGSKPFKVLLERECVGHICTLNL